MKILSENSPLKYLPRELKGEQLLIFDSIRITFEMIEHNYSCLEDRLLQISKPENKKEGVSAIFNHAWNVIDHTSRFIKIYKELPSDSNYEVLNSIKHVNPFRNTLQHLNERINESLLKNRSPFYGILIWFYQNPVTSEISPMTLISGIEYGPKFEFTMPDLTHSNKEINHIWLQTVDKNKIIRTDISQIILDLKSICEQNEKKLIELCNSKGFQLCDWSERKDIMIRIKQAPKKV
ncbi:hypothetical protein P700755_001219 [Psychroflexus torquis ATCC 700755]|uniref:Uncharacterized protein n=1 Tax=Psychroflexus torquis (strain ATCC 700755 / CIP 106069 / ACAM 623) TaxID=313595 RepID=K4IC24_PSYTT|nr:hypothetical protein [Psychroflexus torquis]AFU68157.1 hypothetical protein P700755_001219 [Psychroflexus torquis ATCC 700755]